MRKHSSTRRAIQSSRRSLTRLAPALLMALALAFGLLPSAGAVNAATEQDGGATAVAVHVTTQQAATFVDYAQCANGKTPPGPVDVCTKWTNGILNSQNSTYAEDQVTPQRAEVQVPAGSPAEGRTLTFRYQTRKGTIHAYDYLATWNLTQPNAERCQGFTGAALSSCNALVRGNENEGGSFPIPSDGAPVFPHASGNPLTSSRELDQSLRQMVMFGGDITHISIPEHTNLNATGDDYASITVTYNAMGDRTDGVNLDQPQKVQLLFGGHLAASKGTRGWGDLFGSSNVSGGPYHIKWDYADGYSLGNRDNQIQGGTLNSDFAAISILESATNNVGDAHTFDILVTATGTMKDVVITTTVTPDPSSGAVTDAPCAATLAGDKLSATCTLTINNASPGVFTATARATGKIGATGPGTPFDITTNGEDPNSPAAIKTYACLTHSLTLTVSGAGKSQTSYDNFTGGTWVATAEYSTDGGSTWTALALGAPVDQDGDSATLGDLTFSNAATISTPDSPYTATAVWRFSLGPVGSPIFESGQLPDEITLANEGDCSAADSAVSPVSNVTVWKVLDDDADGIVDNFVDLGLEGWAITATSGDSSVTGTTGPDGSATLAGLDPLVSWTICEDSTGHTGYVQTAPANGGCFTHPANPAFGDDNYTFGNALGTSSVTTTLKNGEVTVADNGSVDLGTVMHDTASVAVNPLNTQVTPGGTVTFTFFPNGTCATDTGTAGTAVELTFASGSANAPSADTVALGAGSYSYQATYSGDDHYAGSTSDCEPFTVNKADPTISTAINGDPNLTSAPAGTALPITIYDTATVGGSVGDFDPTGAVSFTFFSNGTCTPTGTDKTGNEALQSVDVSITGAGSYSFQATIAESANFNAATSACEPYSVTTITIHKLANGGNDTFGYTITNTVNETTLGPSVTTTGTPGTGNVVTVVSAGSYTVGETTLPAGWNLTGLYCGTQDVTLGPTSAPFTAAVGTNTDCNFDNTMTGATRTQGFWSTHTAFADLMWQQVEAANYDKLLTWGCTGSTRVIDATETAGNNELMGSFWSSISRTSTGAKRSSLDQARMQLLQQLTAALLNRYGLGTGELTTGTIAGAAAAYCGTDATLIKSYIGRLATYNQSGDTVPLTQGHQATSVKLSKLWANYAFWDLLLP